MIRRLDLSNLGPGYQTVVWDGQNQAGRPVAPGVYTAWLVGGDKRQNIKLVRVP
jgi:flagellar hook assembly protein FlgD